MKYSQLVSRIKEKLYGSPLCQEEVYLGETISVLQNGEILLNGNKVYSENIEEIKSYISQVKLEEDIAQSLYEDIPTVKIASIIREHHNIKVTNNLIESYVELASSKNFTIDPVVHEIRELNSVHYALNSKIDYILDDGSSIAISEETQVKLNTLLEDKYELVEYMQKNSDNFMYVLRELD